MRTIEKQMNSAIVKFKNWKNGNTQVIFDADDCVSRVYLHGNHIATISEGSVQLFDGGWQSNTTKSRLNAILEEHGIKGERVYQKNFQWYVRMADKYGSFVNIPFYSGINLGDDVLMPN